MKNNFALEIITIVLAVLVALFADQWWQQRELNALAVTSLENINQEIVDNLQRVETSHKHHDWALQLLISAGKFGKDEDLIQAYEKIYSKGVFKHALVSEIAWETAQMMRAINQMNIVQVHKINRVYSVHGIYQDNLKADILARTLVAYSYNEHSLIEMVRGTENSLSELWWMEKNMIRHYKDYLGLD